VAYKTISGHLLKPVTTQIKGRGFVYTNTIDKLAGDTYVSKVFTDTTITITMITIIDSKCL